VLRAAGFEDVCQLQGGMGAWWIAGLPVVKGESDG
jgi:rhodanese-related sulfurtransferase